MASSDRASGFKPYLVASLIPAGTVVWGFWQTYFLPLMTARIERLWVIHLHAAIFGGWIFLLVGQAAAVSLGQSAC
jgi:hypothetical protein